MAVVKGERGEERNEDAEIIFGCQVGSRAKDAAKRRKSKGKRDGWWWSLVVGRCRRREE